MRKPVNASARTTYSMEHVFSHRSDEMLPAQIDRDMAAQHPREMWRVVAYVRQSNGSTERTLHSAYYSEAECDAVMDTFKPAA